jgi:site-specific DNA-methyltransferase (adenine-specific)
MNIVYNRDCMDVLCSIDDYSIDLICIDPPYEISYLQEAWDEFGLHWNELFAHYKRILKPTGNLIIFQGWSNVCNTIGIGNNYFTLNNWIIYDRIKGRGATKNVVSTREDILWYTLSSDPTYNKIPSTIIKKTKGLGEKNGNPYRAMSNVWTDISPIVPWSKERNVHPTQKPIKLMERIVTMFSNEGDTVLDCFAGSGTTLVAAKNLNRNYIGIEREQSYYDIIMSRLNAVE